MREQGLEAVIQDSKIYSEIHLNLYFTLSDISNVLNYPNARAYAGIGTPRPVSSTESHLQRTTQTATQGTAHAGKIISHSLRDCLRHHSTSTPMHKLQCTTGLLACLSTPQPSPQPPATPH